MVPTLVWHHERAVGCEAGLTNHIRDCDTCGAHPHSLAQLAGVAAAGWARPGAAVTRCGCDRWEGHCSGCWVMPGSRAETGASLMSGEEALL